MENSLNTPRISKDKLIIPGTRPIGQQNGLIISSGIAALDELLGGGVPVGSVVLLEEDRHGSYAKVILKYFLAEGVVCNHSSLIASQDMSTEAIIQELPAMIFSDPEPFVGNSASNEKLQIAFRYQNLPSAEKRMQHFGHYFDLTKTMPKQDLEQASSFHWKFPENYKNLGAFGNPAYHHLLDFIRTTIKEQKFAMDDKPSKRTILRIGLHALGSPMWFSSSSLSLGTNRDLSTFIFCLKSIIQSAFAVAFITLPSFLLDQVTVDRCVHSSDIAIKLQSFAGTELEQNPILADYHGYFHLIKLAAHNSFASKHPGSVEYTFKLRRKKFCIEKLHLPPDLEEKETDKTHVAVNCANNTLLDF